MKENTRNLIEKIIAICEDPAVFLSYPISEEAAFLFELTAENLHLKSQIQAFCPLLPQLERLLSPRLMSINKFNLILFLISADYFPINFDICEDSLSTVDTQSNAITNVSLFLKQQMNDLHISLEQFQELDENIGQAFEESDYEDNFF